MVTAARLARVVGIMAMAIGMRVAVAEDFHIDAGRAVGTLNEFSRQSNLQLLFDFNIVRLFETQQIRGDLQPSEALTQMLAGTDLVFDFVNERTVSIMLATSAGPDEVIDSVTFNRWIRQFEPTAQAYAEDAGPARPPLIVEIALTNEVYTASR